MEVTGKIIVILPANSGVSQRSGNPWMSQIYVLETVEQYPKKIPFEVFGEDKIRQFNLQMGETVTIHFDIDGREYKGRWYPSVKCFNVTRAGQAAPNVQNAQQPVQAAPTSQPSAHAPQPQSDGSDLPF